MAEVMAGPDAVRADIIRADYADPAHGAAIRQLLDVYARDPMGGGTPLGDDVLAALVPALAAQSAAFTLLAYADGQAVGLTNSFFAVSTFAARPLVNLHDIVVRPEWRGRGIARALIGAVEEVARSVGACKVTLEVLSGNAKAQALYRSLGYGDYILDPAQGTALFWQKRLAE